MASTMVTTLDKLEQDHGLWHNHSLPSTDNLQKASSDSQDQDMHHQSYLHWATLTSLVCYSYTKQFLEILLFRWRQLLSEQLPKLQIMYAKQTVQQNTSMLLCSLQFCSYSLLQRLLRLWGSTARLEKVVCLSSSSLGVFKILLNLVLFKVLCKWSHCPGLVTCVWPNTTVLYRP